MHAPSASTGGGCIAMRRDNRVGQNAPTRLRTWLPDYMSGKSAEPRAGVIAGATDL